MTRRVNAARFDLMHLPTRALFPATSHITFASRRIRCAQQRATVAMVRMLDLDEDADSEAHPHVGYQHAIVSAVAPNDDERHNPNVNSFTAALSCYP